MVAHRNEGEVDVDLDKRRTLRLDFRACSMYEQEAGGGATVDEFFATLGAEKFSVRKLSILLWACLLHEDRRLTIERVQELMEMSPGDTLARKVEPILRKLTEVYCLRQGVDFSELERRATDAGAQRAGEAPADPPAGKAVGPAS